MAVIYHYPYTAIRVCVDKVDGTKISGRFFCAQIGEEMHFNDMGDLLLRMDKIFDERGYPDAFNTLRSFDDVYRPALHRHVAMPSHDIPDEVFGKKKTLLVYVFSRRNSSWQGEIEWLGEDKRESFNSALEFLRIASDKIIGAKTKLRIKMR